MDNDYVSVTEIAGDEVTQEQIDRLCNRYYWAGKYCAGKEVVEEACVWRVGGNAGRNRSAD